VSISFSGSEIINIAIEIERRGIAFYDVMTRSSGNAATRNIFQYLVDMERRHIQIFQSMLTEADKNQVSKAHSAEYAAYLQTLLDSAVFTNDMVTSELAVNAESDIEAMELAMGAEKDSILFYYGMKDIVPKRVQLTVDKIINEEKSHLRQLWELKKEMSAL
jgi:rubrerythrin